MTQQPENFDHLLDQALHSYSSAEPRFGLEERILARITAQPAARQLPGHLHRGVLWAGLAAICLTVALTVFLSSRRAPQQRQEIVRSIPFPGSTPTSHPLIPPRTTPYIERAAQRPHRTVKPQYGQPRLTSADRLLIQFVALHTEEALAISKPASAADSPIANNPIVVQPIRIKPISSEPVVIQAITMDQEDHPSF